MVILYFFLILHFRFYLTHAQILLSTKNIETKLERILFQEKSGTIFCFLKEIKLARVTSNWKRLSRGMGALCARWEYSSGTWKPPPPHTWKA